MTAIFADLRYAARLLLTYPGLTLVAVAALAVGIGANVTIFGFVNAVVLQPLDVRDPERLIRADSGGDDLMPAVPYSDYVEYRDRNQSLSSLAMFRGGWMSAVRIDGPAQMIAVTPVTGNYFDTLGLRARLGRTLNVDDDREGASPVIVLSHEGHRRYFGSDPSVLGRTVIINEQAFAVVGVLPKSFRGTVLPNLPQIYAPFVFARKARGDVRGYFIGRLANGVSREQVEADLVRIASQLSDGREARRTIATHEATAAYPQFVSLMKRVGLVFLIVVGAVLWIACSNVAVLLLARAATRQREIGVRLALGASRWQLLRQLLTESLALAFLGGIGAACLAHAISRWLTQIYLPVPMPIALVYDFDWRVLGFAVAISFTATLMCGLLPARSAMRVDILTSVQGAEPSPMEGTSRVGGSMVVAQVALTTALLATAGLAMRSATAPRELGFDSNRVLWAVVRFLGSDHGPNEADAFFAKALAELERDPGVAAATAVESVPLTNNQGPLRTVPVSKESGEALGGDDDGTTRPIVYTNQISRGHFRTLSIPLLDGRDFGVEDDRDSASVGIVNETLARRFWPGERPVGKFLYRPDGARIEIVGLARDSKYERHDEEPKAFLYRPLTQGSVSTVTFLVRTPLETERAASLVRQKISQADPDVVAYNVQPLDERFRTQRAGERALAWVAGVLGLLGVGLGAIGTYGILSFLMQQRRREMGVRLAMGASPAGIVKLLTRQGTAWTLYGVALGTLLFYGAARLLSSLLRDFSASDPIPILAVAALLLVTGYVTCLLPARRASTKNPLAALRE